MKFYFSPHSDDEFKNKAIGNYVRTIIYDLNKDQVVFSFIRKVKTIWVQTCKNNIESDHRVKELKGNDFEIYSWVVKSKNSLNLPGFLNE